jgi:hypothetical protein
MKARQVYLFTFVQFYKIIHSGPMVRIEACEHSIGCTFFGNCSQVSSVQFAKHVSGWSLEHRRPSVTIYHASRRNHEHIEIMFVEFRQFQWSHGHASRRNRTLKVLGKGLLLCLRITLWQRIAGYSMTLIVLALQAS